MSATIHFEGLPGSGKTTASEQFFKLLRSNGVDASLWLEMAPRQDGGNQCQPAVGSWGSGSSLRYDGGHLVPSRLNGYGGRTNLVPQDRKLNRGMWKNDIEATSFYCINDVVSQGGISHYWVTSLYDSDNITPNRFEAHLTWQTDIPEEAGFAIDNAEPEGLDWDVADLFKFGVVGLCLL